MGTDAVRRTDTDDLAKGEKIKATAEGGGPIPADTYYVMPLSTHTVLRTGQNIQWYFLATVYDGHLNFTAGTAKHGRGEFGLHPGLRTDGCIICGSDAGIDEWIEPTRDWQILRTYLDKSATQSFNGTKYIATLTVY